MGLGSRRHIHVNSHNNAYVFAIANSIADAEAGVGVGVDVNVNDGEWTAASREKVNFVLNTEGPNVRIVRKLMQGMLMSWSCFG